MTGRKKITKARTGGKGKLPVDPADSPTIALSGQIGTMDSAFTVIKSGTLYLEQGSIVAVAKGGDPAAAGFEGVQAVETGGTIFPGFIELQSSGVQHPPVVRGKVICGWC